MQTNTKTKKVGILYSLNYKESLEYVLLKGFNPFEDNTSLADFIEQLLTNEKNKKKIIEETTLQNSSN